MGLAEDAVAMGLADFVKASVEADPQVREQIHAYRQVVQDHRIALSGWLPSLDLSTSSERFYRNGPTSTDLDSHQVDMTLTQNLFDGFNTTNQIRQARSRITSAVYQLFDTADNAALEAVRTYLGVLSERRLVNLARENVDSHERILSQILAQSTAGIGRRSDLDQTEGRLASAKASLISQQNNLQDALTRLHKVLGRYLYPEELVDPTPPELPAGTIEQLIEQALANHPALESARKNIEAARYDYRRSKQSFLPQLDLQLQQSMGDNIDRIDGSEEERSVLLNLQYNLFRGGADWAEKKKRISALHENEAFRSRVRRQVIDAMRLAWTADRALDEQLPLLDLYVEKAQQTLDLYHEEFFLNKRDLIDVLDAESELNTAKRRRTQAFYDAIAARFRIYEGLGGLFQPLGLNVEVTESDLRVADIRAQGIDTAEPGLDADRDEYEGDRDQCDNSSGAGEVDAYGCETHIEQVFGYVSSSKPPVAADDAYSTAMNVALSISPGDLLGNDSDEDGDHLSIEAYSRPVSGTLSEDADGYLLYAPPEGFSGADEFTYTITDGRGQSATARVRINVGDVEVAEPVEPGVLPPMLEVRFGYKQLTLTPGSQARLDALMPLLQDPEVGIEIRAYTDDVGPDEYNLRLSAQRAQALRRLLMDGGIDGARILAIGMGESDPIADNSTEAGRARNRRGEISFITGGGRHDSGEAPAADETDVGNTAEDVREEVTNVPGPSVDQPPYTPPQEDGKDDASTLLPDDTSMAPEVEVLQFGYKQAGITADSTEKLDRYARQFKRTPGTSVEIRAYTDDVGSPWYNQALSAERAELIKQMLLDRGIEEGRIRAVGMGASDPIVDNATKDGRALNRRAELYLLPGELN